MQKEGTKGLFLRNPIKSITVQKSRADVTSMCFYENTSLYYSASYRSEGEETSLGDGSNNIHIDSSSCCPSQLEAPQEQTVLGVRSA